MSNHEPPIAAATMIYCYLISGRIERIEGMFVQVAVGLENAVAGDGVVIATGNIDSEGFVEVS